MQKTEEERNKQKGKKSTDKLSKAGDVREVTVGTFDGSMFHVDMTKKGSC